MLHLLKYLLYVTQLSKNRNVAYDELGMKIEIL